MPKWAAMIIPATAEEGGELDRPVVARSSRSTRAAPTRPSPAIATAKTMPPATVIAIAKTIQGIANRIRFRVSPRSPRRRRGGAICARAGARRAGRSSKSPSARPPGGSSPPACCRLTPPRCRTAKRRAPRKPRRGRRSRCGRPPRVGSRRFRRSRPAGHRQALRPEAAPASLELAQRLLEGLAVEVGPQLLAEDELRVGALPEQVVGDPLLAAGADQQVGVVHLGRVEAVAELLLGVPLEAFAPHRRSPPCRRS